MHVPGVWSVVVVLITGCEPCNNDGPDNTPDGPGPMCMRNDDCVTGLICAGGTCQPPGSVPVGGACSATRDCAANLNCSELGMCVPAGTGAAGATCSSAADCMHELACIHDGFGGTCTVAGATDIGGTCTTTANCIAGLHCGRDDTCEPLVTAFPPWPGATCAPDLATFGAFFEVPRTGTPLADFYRLPFPSDVRVRANDTLDLSDFPRPGKSILGVDIVDLYADALEQDFEGFSSVAPVSFRFTKELEFGSLGANGENIKLVDITPSTPEFGSELARGWGYSTARRKFHCQHVLTLGNGRGSPLLPGHTYAAYLTTAIRSKANEPPMVGADLTAILGATAPPDPDLAAAWTKHASFRQFLTTNTISPSTIAAVAVYTVANSPLRARQIAQAVTASPVPSLSDLTLCDGVATSPCAGEDGRACGDSSGAFWEIHGRYTEPNYQMGTRPYAIPADGGQITYTGTTPNAQGSVSVCVAMTIPKTTAPGTGWPLVVHAHGTGGSFKAAVTGGIAQRLATAASPTATLTFDGIAHGERRGGSMRSVESLVFNVVNPRAARDNHLQGAVDVMQALRVAQVAPFTVGTVANIDFDATRTYYFGHSQGSNMGIPGVAVSNFTTAAVFSGAGSDLTLGILNKTNPVNAKAGLELLLGDPLHGGHPVMVLWQTFFDRIDPLNFDPLLVQRPLTGVPSKHVMVTWSATDTFSPKDTLTSTVLAGRLLQAEPVLEPIATSDPRPITTNRSAGDGLQRFATVFQYASDGTYDGHFVAQNNPQALADWTAFFMSLNAAGTPTVP